MEVDKISRELPILFLGGTYIVVIKIHIYFIFANSQDSN